MFPAWAAAVRAALGDDNMVASFQLATGMKWTRGRTTLDRKIDDATGADETFLRAFIAWFNENVWGPLG